MKRIERNLISIEVPDNWEVWNQNEQIDPSVQIAAKIKEGKYPNIEITKIGRIRNTDISQTRNFARNWVNKHGLRFISERFIKVTGRDAFEISYEKKPFLNFFGSTLYFTKVSLSRNGIEYLIQLASKKFEIDKPIFDTIVSSMRFEFVTEEMEREKNRKMGKSI